MTNEEKVFQQQQKTKYPNSNQLTAFSNEQHIFEVYFIGECMLNRIRTMLASNNNEQTRRINKKIPFKKCYIYIFNIMDITYSTEILIKI